MALLWLTPIDPTKAFIAFGLAIAIGYATWIDTLQDSLMQYLGTEVP